uniref:Uncharacterized protein n=1 Tax=Chlamydomonas leiostraca TaxID=1034604 RepID=A0A7S0RNN8_9CHLO
MKQRVVHTTKELTQQQDPLASNGPLDEDEQEEIVQELELEQLRQTRLWRGCFGVGAMLMAVFFAWASWTQWAHPWSLRMTGELRAATHGNDVVAVLGVQAVALGAVSIALLRKLPKRGERERMCMPYSLSQKLLLGAGILGCAACASYWLSAHARMVQQFGSELGARWELIWVPLGPLAYSGVSLWAASVLARSGAAVAELRSFKYNHKKV